MPDPTPAPRRVLMTADAVGGVWTYALDLARALSEEGVAVALAVMGAAPTQAQIRDARQIPRLEVSFGPYKLEWMADPWPDVERAGGWLLELEERSRPDVVHLNGYTHGALPWKSPTVVVGHSDVVSWWQAVHDEPPPASWARYATDVRAGLRAVGRVVAPTRAMLDLLERNYGPLPPADVVPNGRDPSLFRPGRKEGFILTAGRLWDQAKNVGALARVAPALPWPVYVAGQDASPDGAPVALGAVRPLGRLTPQELAPWFGRAAIYALPARYEPFGLSAVEGGLCGCALVLGDIPSLREVWGDAARFVPPDDTAALQATLAELIADDAGRQQLAAKGRARALEYTPQRMAAGYLNAYRAAMQGKPPPV